MREPTRPRLSGWCSPCTSPKAHAECQSRLDRQLLTRCECKGCRNGDEKAQNPHSIRDSGAPDDMIRDESGPESALTDRGQRSPTFESE